MTRRDIPQKLKDNFPGISSYAYKRIVQIKMAYHLGREAGIEEMGQEADRLIAGLNTPAGSALSAGGIASQRPAAESAGNDTKDQP